MKTPPNSLNTEAPRSGVPVSDIHRTLRYEELVRMFPIEPWERLKCSFRPGALPAGT